MSASSRPIQLAEAAKLILATGRARMAASLSEQLPAAIHEAMVRVASRQYLEGRADAERLRRQRAAARARHRPTPLDRLKTKLADQELRARPSGRRGPRR